MKPQSSYSRFRSRCPISLSLDVLGDKWTLLVLRDLIFWHKRHFRDFLSSDEKIATNILANRLRLLQAAGIVVRSPDPSNARQVIYRLTQKGSDLIPLLIELIVWGARYEDSAAPADFLRRAMADREGLIAEIRASVTIADPM